ncbi:hypothetical protein PG996_015958 [Apiospora saccharicola]|uniref:Uncharacterized protein n=1 Tax=Apiospora saccharicola TaxID=335842 RepID=A0ABR1TMK5_9PEZI
MNHLPEPAQVFDTLLARGVAVRDNPSQISSFFLGFAALISIDRAESQHAKHKGMRRLRLTPLYGRSSTEASPVRVFTNGLLKDDMFAFSEPWRMSPGVRVLLVMFNRFHNYIARGLLAYGHPTTIKRFEIGSNVLFNSINECNRFPKSWTATERDEAVYQMAQRITGRLYINIILNDYLRTFLGINRTDKEWNLEPETLNQIFPSSDIEASESGPHDSRKVAMDVIVDNWWRSAISEEDTDYMSQNQPSVFRAGSTDNEMTQELFRSVQAIASTFSPNRVPVSFRESQIRTITRARERQMPSLNEFRHTVGLPTYKKIEDVSSSPLVAAKLKSLYSSPDEIELYPGVIAEEPPRKAVFAASSIGKWLWTGSTVAHAVVRDTVALIRDDPYYTDEWSPSNVTSWGFREPASDENVSYGCVMHKLILRAFPKHFAPDSVYVHFPFVIPEGNRVILAELGSDASYSFEAKPGRPAEPAILGLTAVVGFASIHARPVIDLTGTLESSKHKLRKTLEPLKHSMRRMTYEGPIEIDLVVEVIAPYLVEAFCSQFALTLSDNGSLSTEVWQAMKSIHAPACNLDPVHSLKLERQARDAVEKLRAPILKSEKAWMGRSLRETIFGGWQDSQDVDHSLCPAIKMVAHRLVDLQQVLVEGIEYFTTDGRKHITNIRQLSADMNGDNPDRSRKAAARLFAENTRIESQFSQCLSGCQEQWPLSKSHGTGVRQGS